jgi:hypothetical protein
LLVGFALVWGASGCNCGEPPVESELEVAFEKPTDGQRLTLDDDADPAAEGFQYEVVAVARDTAERTVRVASAKLELRTPNGQAWQEGPEAIIDGATVRFPGTLLNPRTNVLQVTVEEAGSRRSATQRITVTVSTDPPSVELTQPAEGQVLREADDADPDTAGYQLRFSVKSVGLAGKTGTLYCEQACGVPPTDFTVNSSGLTQVPVTLSEPACQAQQAACYAVVRTGNGGTQDVRSSRRSITLDTGAPRVEVTSPVAPVSSRTFRVEAVVGCCEDGSPATLTRSGAPPMEGSVVGGLVSFPTVSVPEDGLFSYSLRITDAGGNVTETPLMVHVASLPATVSLSVPGMVTTDADGDPTNGIQADVVATTSATAPETEMEFYMTVGNVVGNPIRVATAAAPGVGRIATLRMSLAEGSRNSVRACVRNPALPPTCQSVSVNVSTGRPSCRIVSPLDADMRGTAASRVPVQVETSASSVTVRVRPLSGGPESSTGPVAAPGGVAQVDVNLPTDQDRSYRLVADCGTNGVSQAITVTRDTAPPSLTAEISGDVAGVLGPATQDTSTQAGTQVKVTARTEPFTVVRLTGCAASNSFTAESDATGLVVLRDVSVPSTGSCSLTVSATDRAGNVSTLNKPLTLALTRGAIALNAPAVDRVLGPSDGTVIPGDGLSVEVKVGITGNGSGTLKLFVGATEVGLVAVTAGDTEKTFPGVPLREGANVVRATLSGAAGTTACVTALLTVDTTPAAITLLNPRQASSFGLVDDNNNGVPGIQRTLSYSVSAASAGAQVDICSSRALRPGAAPCRDGSDFFTLASNVEPFVSEFTFPDGQYSIKAVLEDGSFSSSQEVALVVDSERPRVTRVTIEADTNNDGQLNITEQPTGSPTVHVTVTGLEDGRTVQVRNASDGTLFGQATATGGSAQVVLTGLPNLTEANYSLVTVVTDGVGNSNKISNPVPLDPLNTEAFFSLRVDRSAPALTISSPNRASLGIADDADPAQVGYQVRLSLATSTDVGVNGVEMTLTPPGTVVRRTPSGQAVSELFTLPSSGTTAYEFQVRATDRAGNTTTLTRTFTVDLEPPGLTVNSPVAGSTYNSITVPLHADVTGAEGASVEVSRTPVGGGTRTPVTSLQVTAGVASGSASLPRGAHDLIFEVRDSAGNLASRIVSNVQVNFSGCDPRFTRPVGTPVTLIQRDDLDPNTVGLQYRVEGEAPACAGRQVRLFRDGAAAPEATTVADAATGAFSFDVTLPDGQSTTLRVEMDDGAGNATSVSAVLNVDITPPVLSNVVPAETSLFFVADSNEALFLVRPTPGYVQDQVQGGNAEADISARIGGAQNGQVRVTYNGTDVATPATPATNDETVSLAITLPHDTTGALVVLVRDAAGNEVRHTANAVVDVLPPANPNPQVAIAPGAERTATVDVNWTAVGDDGMAGVPSGYDLRWTHEAALSGGIPDDVTYFRGRVVRAPSLPAESTVYTLSPLPPFETYSIQLRARDEVGNYSRFAPSQTLVNRRSRDVLDPGGNGTRFGFVVASNGDLDGVAGDDLVVSDFNENTGQGAVYVFSGASGTAQALVPPADPAQSFGWDMAIGNVGDAAGEARPDLIVGAPGWLSSRGRAFLYFGRTGAGVQGVDPSPIELRGTSAGSRFGIAARIINDINQDGLSEVAISASSEDGDIGRVYLYFGRTRAAWEALRVDESTGAACTGATTACIIPTSRADRVIVGEDVTSALGRWRGMVGLGDITGDGVADFGVPVSRETVNRYYVFSGAAVRSSSAPIVASSALQRLLQPVGTEANSYNGFGMAAVGGLNLIGGAGPDLAVSRARFNTVFIYTDGGPTGFTTAPVTIQGSGTFGNSLAAGDINLDGRPDLVIGTDRLDQGSAWVFYNSPTGFDASVGGFNQANLVSTGAKALGVSVAVGDFNADGKPDIAAGDNLDPLGRRVKIWY